MKKQTKKQNKNFRGGFLFETYSEIWGYLKESRNFILGAALIFVIFAFVGFLYPNFFTKEIASLVEEIAKKTEGLNAWQLMGYIFENNVLSTLSSIIFGVVLGIVPIISLVANGYVLGFVGNLASNASGEYAILLKLLPHGIFELPAAIIAMAIGIRLGWFIFSKNIKKEFLRRFFMSVKILIFVVIPLLIIAAIIEGLLIALAR